MQPHWTDQITNKFVSDFALLYEQEHPFDVMNMMPPINSRQISGYLADYNKADWLKIGTTSDYKRVGAVESTGDEYRVGYQPYHLDEYAFHKDISKDDRNEYDNPYEPVQDAVRFVMHRINRVLVQLFYDTFFGSGIWSSDVSLSAAKWSSSTNDPVAKVLEYRESIHSTTGFWPNRLAMSPNVYRNLKTNTKITDKMKTTSDKVVTRQMLAKLFEVDSIGIFDAVNTGGTAHMSTGEVILFYAPDRPSKFSPTSGAFILYKNRKATNVTMKRIKMEEKNDALRIEGWTKAKPMVVAKQLGVRFHTVV